MSRNNYDGGKSFNCRPAKGWIYPDEMIINEGVSFNVRYIGCIEIFTSMKVLDFQTRALVAKECISRVCEAANIRTPKKSRGEKRITDSISSTPCMEHSGANVVLNISSVCLKLTSVDTGTVIAKHEMPKISFASSGDTDTNDFVAYVAKDVVDWRACYVLECGEGKAQNLISTIGHAFELRYKEFYQNSERKGDNSFHLEDNLKKPIVNVQLSHNNQCDYKSDLEYYNDLPGKMPPDLLTPNSLKKSNKLANHQGHHQRDRFASNLIDLSPSAEHEYVNDDKHSSNENNLSFSSNNNHNNLSNHVKDIFDIQSFPIPPDLQRSQLLLENWYHGPINRSTAENLLKCDGDFLVRDTQGQSGQYVLTGMQLSQPKHLLLIDPEGVVRTKDRVFESISHLINYHWTNALPIISSESALVLRTPIIRTTDLTGTLGKNYK